MLVARLNREFFAGVWLIVLVAACQSPPQVNENQAVVSNDDALIELINGVWSAAEFNRLCPGFRIDSPLEEADLAVFVARHSPSDIVAQMEQTEVWEGLSVKDHAKMTIGYAVGAGCDTEDARQTREDIVKSLNYFEMLN